MMIIFERILSFPTHGDVVNMTDWTLYSESRSIQNIGETIGVRFASV